jgi:hypothetical protein
VANNAVQGFPDTMGKHSVAPREITGLASYTTGGDTVTLATPSWGGSSSAGTRGFSFVSSAEDYSGTYQVEPVYSTANTPNSGIRNSVALRWTYSGGGLGSGNTGVNAVEVALGSGPTNGTYTITATTGVGKIQIIVAGGAVTSVEIINPGSYTSPPTFTPSAGLGSGASITALVGSLAGLEVAPGTNLSGYTVRLLVIGG